MFSTLLIRLFDLIISVFFLLLFSPIFLIIVILIYIFDGSPILYISDRVGLNGSVFKIYKFRTMKTKTTINEMDVISKLGKYLRRSSIDEIPQFFNILKNDMSVVGPRPLPTEIERQISNDLKKIRRQVKPGITGYAQIKFNNKRRDWKEKSELDIEYVKNISVYNYILVILLTFPTLLKRFSFNKKGRTL